MLVHGHFVDEQQSVVRLENYLYCTSKAVEIVDVVHERVGGPRGGGYRLSVNGKRVSVVDPNAQSFNALQTYWQTNEGQPTPSRPVYPAAPKIVG